MWPSARQYLERPERFKYVRKLIPTEGCVFCKAARKGVGFESLVLYVDPLVMVVLNKFPYNSGHVLILPKRHLGDLVETTPEENQAMADLVKKSVAILRSVYTCDGLNVGLNLGSAAGAGIPGHIHWHVVPRWNGDTNFFPLLAETKVLPETLEQSFERLAPKFRELG